MSKNNLIVEELLLEIQACNNIIRGTETMILLDDDDSVSKAEYSALLEKHSAQLLSCQEELEKLRV